MSLKIKLSKNAMRLMLIAFMAAVFSITAYAAPSNLLPRQVVQTDGTVITVTNCGDEYFSWTEDSDGYVIAYNTEDENWYYAEIAEEQIKPGFEIAGNGLTLGRTLTEKITREDLTPLIDKAERLDYSQFKQSNLSRAGISPVTDQKILVVLLEFNDMPLFEMEQFWYEQYFSTDSNKRSVVNYYKEVSGGLDIFAPASTKNTVTSTGTYLTKLILPEGFVANDIEWAKNGVNITIFQSAYDGVIRVKFSMDHPMPIWNDDYAPPHTAVSLALRAIKENSSFDFGAYGDNLHIAAVFSGGEASVGYNPGGQIWGSAMAVSEEITGQYLKLMWHGEMNEYEIPEGIGVACHELGHTLGLPDLYDTTYASSGVGVYSLMGSGSHGDASYPYNDDCPVHLDAWSKTALGYMSPITVSSSEYRKVNVNSIEKSLAEYNIFKIISSADPNQYFLVENRGLAGYDAGFEGEGIYPNDNDGGIIIYHVDESVEQTNTNEYHRFIDVEESDGKESLNKIVVGYSGMNHFYSTDEYNSIITNKFNWETTPNTNFHQLGHTPYQSDFALDCHPQTVQSSINIIVNSQRSAVMEVEFGFIPVTNITRVPGKAIAGTALSLEGTINPANATSSNITWSVVNAGTTGANINNGILNTKSSGTVIVRATIINGKSTGTNYTQDFTITMANSGNIPVTGISLNRSVLYKKVGQTEQLKVYFSPSNATYQTVIWSSDNKNIAAVDNSGVITALSAGTANITASASDGGFSAVCKIIIDNIRVTGISLDRTDITLAEGHSEKLYANISPYNATNQGVTWSSDNENIAVVDSEGNVTAVSAGKANITVKTAENDKTAACVVNVVAGTVSFEYTENENGIKLTQYTGTAGNVTIPETIGGKPVTAIESGTFTWIEYLKSVTIHDNINEIGNGAFGACRNLKEIIVDNNNSYYSSSDGVLFNKDKTKLITCPGGKTGKYIIPDSVNYIEYSALQCYSLTSISFPDSVIYIELNWLWECTNLAEILVNGSNENYASVDGVLFNKDKTSLIFCPNGKTGKYIIPKDTVSIGEYAFYNCSNLTAIIISNTVTEIKSHSFYGCSNLKEIIIPDSINFIDSWAFIYCNNLSAVYFHHLNTADIDYFGTNIFDGAAEDFKIIYPVNSIGFTTPSWSGYPAFPATPVTIESDIYEIESGSNFMKGIESGDDVSEIKTHLIITDEANADNLLFYKYDGTILSDTDKVGTGSYIIDKMNSAEPLVIIIISGDVTGEGDIDETDFEAALEYIKSGNPANLTEEVFAEAAKMSDGERVDIEDLMIIRGK
jgi:M6 family metalloprotease-like protein